MPRPLRQPDETERAELDIIADINVTIARNIERNKALSKDRRERVQSLIDRGWSIIVDGVELSITLTLPKRILESDKPKPQGKPLLDVLGESNGN